MHQSKGLVGLLQKLWFLLVKPIILFRKLFSIKCTIKYAFWIFKCSRVFLVRHDQKTSLSQIRRFPLKNIIFKVIE